MFKFLKNLFSPVQIPPQKPETHPLDGATRAAHEKNTLIASESAPAVKEEIVVIVDQPVLAEPVVAVKKPRKPRAKKEQPVEAQEPQWPFGTPVAAMTTAKKPRKPRAKKAE